MMQKLNAKDKPFSWSPFRMEEEREVVLEAAEALVS